MVRNLLSMDYSLIRQDPALSPFPIERYILAVASVAISIVAILILPTLSRSAPFMMFWPAVILTLWYAGFRPALLATLLSAAAIDFVLLPPYFSFRMGDWQNDLLRECFFVASLGITSYILDRNRTNANFHLTLQSELLELADEAIIITDRLHSVVFWNGGAERLYGWTRAEATGKDVRELLETTYPERREVCGEQLNATGRWQGRLLQVSKSGGAVVTESSWTLHRKTGAILQTDVNVTERNRAEGEEKRLKHALSALSEVNRALLHAQEENQLLQNAVKIIAESGGYPLVWIGVPEDDPECTVRIVARAGTAVDFIPAAKITWNDEPSGQGPCGRTLRQGRGVVVHDLTKAVHLSPWREFAQTKGLWSVACQPLTFQGKVIAALTVYAAEENAFGELEINLITELAGDLSLGIAAARTRKWAEKEKEKRQGIEKQLQQSERLEAVGQLAGGIAHDFNNLLMVIMAQVELLSLHLSGTALERTGKVMQSAHRAAALTAQLLAFSRKQIFQPQVMSLNQVVPGISEILQRLVREDIDIRVVLCKGPWMVEIDRSQIERVIMNLVVNARDAMPNGGILTIETENCEMSQGQLAAHPLVPPGRYAMLAVSDTGVGMTAEVKARLFEPFFTTKEQGKGTGLGLSMAYGIVKQSDGFIWIYSELGKGTSFKIYLPIANKVQLLSREGSASGAVQERRNATVLVVEDDAGLRDVISDFLISGGHTVIAAEGPVEACRLAFERRAEIDLLLTDVVLKEGNGKQLVQQLRDQGCTFNVIYMSGYTPNAIVHHGVLDSGVLFLQKPFSRPALLDKIEVALGENGGLLLP
jgi:PAS domain S-box-containing protein